MNSLSTTLLVGAGGFIGANARYWLGAWIQGRASTAFPWNTLWINITGSLLIGLFMGLYLRETWAMSSRLFFVVGVLGGYTTFSSFSYESILLLSEKNYSLAGAYVVISVAASLCAAWVGLALAKTVL